MSISARTAAAKFFHGDLHLILLFRAFLAQCHLTFPRPKSEADPVLGTSIRFPPSRLPAPHEPASLVLQPPPFALSRRSKRLHLQCSAFHFETSLRAAAITRHILCSLVQA